ncbi:hypothetical protein [Paenibacillus endoradicis]|uniref:hypothetical protein n=1 Tax=Paenibacillus endoradicis TaxID=2972487 RepID=UPI002158F36C|nr:hypothetical protein [Paenibacillus endoradicis]MCR8656089.1 hypothetical protein [Paenibacillus endoradicis]MCR8658415.1 hypothetical protein [Paenibacillus endoradicis]
MRRINWRIRVTIILCAVLLQGCSIITGNRTGDDWLELVHAGITAEDDFRFDGSVAMGFTDGIALTPYSFEGEIQSHKQIALYVKEKNSLVRNPVNDLDFIAMNYSNAEIVYEGLDKEQEQSIVVIQVTADEEAATSRWKDQLEQELTSVTIQAIGAAEEGSSNVKLVQQEAREAEAALAEMLKELKVSMKYTITIDKLRAKPLKMEEYVDLHYKKNGSPLNEYRKTNIKFDLDGLEAG